jgi:hypothetical protein
VLCQWAPVSGATKYTVERSTDNSTWTALTTTETSLQYLDTTVLIQVLYYYRALAQNLTDTSPYTNSQTIIATITGDMTLSQVALAARQRADRVNSNFVTAPELSSYINQSYFELYDILTNLFQDYYVAEPAKFLTNGQNQYDLPNGVTTFQREDGSNFIARPLYKLIGVDLGLNTSANGWVTVNKFTFIDRNRFVYPNTASTIYGVFNMQYRMLGDKIEFIPTPTSGQPIRLWYVPRMESLLQNTDVLKGVSGWTEYVIVDTAIKILQKEESDVTVLMAQKQALLARINNVAANRDAGQPDKISDTRGNWGGYGDRSGGPGGPLGGW